MSDIKKTEDEWRSQLTAEQFAVCRQKGTEAPFSGTYCDEKAGGVYHCCCCDAPLFASGAKFDSGTGWPSYFQPVSDSAVATEEDVSHGMRRTEVTCAACGSHLGHMFPDGPEPTGLRYCINSVSLKLVPGKLASENK